MVDYKAKLLEKKIDSMNQNDRIEFYTINNLYKNRTDMKMLTGTIFYASAFSLLVIGVFLRLIGFGYYSVLGNISVAIGGIFLLTSIYIVFMVFKAEKVAKKKLEKILERRKSKK